MNFEASQLQETLHLINLIYYRNKNQHRHQKWWKWLSIFRQSVRAMVALLAAEQERRTDLLNGVRPVTAGARERDRERLEQTVEWMKRIGVERCWLAFTSLVSDTQFSILGVVLVAILARFAKVIGYKPAPEATQQLPSIPKVSASDQGSSRRLPCSQPADTTMTAADVGVAISRDQVQNGASPATATKATTELSILPTATTSQSNRMSSSTRLLSQPPPILPKSKGKKRNSNLPPASESPSSSTQPAAEAITMHRSWQPSKSQPKSDPSSRKKKKKSNGPGNAIDDLFAGLT